MHVKVPEVNRCCFCFPLRYGILMFGILNIIVKFNVTTELKKVVTHGAPPQDLTSTVLFSILGMGVILNIVLLVGGCQKDASMMRLYNYYATVTTLAALVPLSVMMSRRQFGEAAASIVAIGLQIYVIILVRSEIIKLEKIPETPTNTNEEEIAVADTATLI